MPDTLREKRKCRCGRMTVSRDGICRECGSFSAVRPAHVCEGGEVARVETQRVD